MEDDNNEPFGSYEEATVVFEDIGYEVRSFKGYSHALSFEVYKIDHDKKYGAYLSGSIKWDGCSNLSFDYLPGLMLHFCSKSEAINIGVLLGRLYDIAAAYFPGDYFRD